VYNFTEPVIACEAVGIDENFAPRVYDIVSRLLCIASGDGDGESIDDLLLQIEDVLEVFDGSS